jgi:peroxiredoxin
MAKTNSTMYHELGDSAPYFELRDPNGRVWELDDFADSKAFVVVFVCNHCPYVIHIAKVLGELAIEFKRRKVAFFAINSNDSEAHPDDSPEKMLKFAKKYGWDFPYLVDPTQETAANFHASCTPDFFVFDSDQCLSYMGQFDNSRPDNDEPITGASLRMGLKCTLGNKYLSEDMVPSSGCNIKWKPANAPDYVDSED